MAAWSMAIRAPRSGTHLLLSKQVSCHGVQSLQCDLLWLAHIEAVERAVLSAIGPPVPLPPPVASLLAPHRKGSERTAHTEDRSGVQPGRPGRGSHT